jgi:hypothetical protein
LARRWVFAYLHIWWWNNLCVNAGIKRA